MKKKPKNIPASVHHRLLQLSKDRNEPYNTVLIHYALERLLYRLSQSSYRDLFTLKGALLFGLWGADRHRPTQDVDLLAAGEVNLARFEAIFRDICAVPCPEDGLVFHADSVKGEMRREDQLYEGIRLQLKADLDGRPAFVQIDIGFGDAITPAAVLADYPTLLELPVPHLRTYPRETVVAEKFQALVALGMGNTRLKDFFDMWTLAQRFAFDGLVLSQAFAATFQRRQTDLPGTTPLALTLEFAEDAKKQTQWQAFLQKNKLDTTAGTLTEIVSFLSSFLLPPVVAMRAMSVFMQTWPPGGTWQSQPNEQLP